MRGLLLIITLVGGCATDDEITTETDQALKYGGCRATNGSFTFEGYWGDQAMTRCCQDITRDGQTQTYCVSCDRGTTCASTYPASF